MQARAAEAYTQSGKCKGGAGWSLPWLVLRTAGKYLMCPRQSQPRARLEQEKPRP